MMQPVWFLARTELIHLLRQKETLLWTFLMPPLFMFFFGMMSGGGGGNADAPIPLALVVEAKADGFLLDELVRRLEAENFRVDRDPKPDVLPNYRRRLTVPATPDHASFTAAVLAGEQVVLRFRRAGSNDARTRDRIKVNKAVYTVLAGLATAKVEKKTVDAALFRDLDAAPRNLKLEVKPAGKRKEIPSGLDQSIPGNMIMFTMMIMLTGGAITLVTEREQGLLRRLASTPITRGQIVAGKWLGKLALGLVQILFAVLVSVFAFGMDWGPHKLSVALVLLLWAAFNTSLGILLGNLARSEGQMTGLGVIASLVLAALGGCWWPIEITPDWMQGLAAALPTGWAMQSIHSLVSFQEDVSMIVRPLVGLAVGTLLLSWLARRTFRYQ